MTIAININRGDRYQKWPATKDPRKNTMRLLVVGAGATGGYFGGRLAQAGRDVTFLVRAPRAEKLRQEGLRIVSPSGDITVAPQVIERNALTPFDAVLLTVKAFSLNDALNDMAPAVGPQTMILPVLNGMKHVDAIASRFSSTNVVGCVCKVATILREDGAIVQLAPFHELAYGEMSGEARPSERISELDRFMSGAGFDARLSTSIAHEMWEKWMMLAALGGITCLMRGNVGQIAAADGGRDFVFALLNEVAAIAKASGQPMSDAFMTSTRALLTAEGSAMTSSMYRDLERRQRIEAEQIIGDLLARGHKFGIAMPYLAAVWIHLQVYQMRLPRS
jgi:2-dehydropantoate 2-reductase